jgi:ketosteroid isomerase-like protein
MPENSKYTTISSIFTHEAKLAADDLIRQEILAANARFYAALAQADIAAMTELWHHGPTTECVHPGWDRLRGWPDIEQSWIQILQHQGTLLIQSSDLFVHWRGDMAWVTCYENITLHEGAMTQISQMLATNVFEWIDGQWRMVIHHASPAPPGIIHPRSWRTSLN